VILSQYFSLLITWRKNYTNRVTKEKIFFTLVLKTIDFGIKHYDIKFQRDSFDSLQAIILHHLQTGSHLIWWNTFCRRFSRSSCMESLVQSCSKISLKWCCHVNHSWKHVQEGVIWHYKEEIMIGSLKGSMGCWKEWILCGKEGKWIFTRNFWYFTNYVRAFTYKKIDSLEFDGLHEPWYNHGGLQRQQLIFTEQNN